jgi:hypothetical protein
MVTKLEPQQQLIAWQKAVENAPDGKVTAARVYKVVKEMKYAEKIHNTGDIANPRKASASPRWLMTISTGPCLGKFSSPRISGRVHNHTRN